MRNFISIEDVKSAEDLANEAITLKSDPFKYEYMGKRKVLGLIFFNSSLRTRMSLTRAAYNLGMQVMVLNVSQDSWQLETEEGAVMDQSRAEHISEAAAVMGNYCDVLGVRSFPTLKDRNADYSEHLVKAFSHFGNVPVINMESATLHPLQSLADLITIIEHKKIDRPKVVLSWAPHIKPLPQSVPNSFAQWMNASNVDFYITHPEGLELSEEFSKNAKIIYNQEEALQNADFVYVKNWSSYHDYGKIYHHQNWMMTLDKMKKTNHGKLMHCLPVRRNVVISDDAMDSKHSIIIHQAENRVYSAQIVLVNLLKIINDG